MFIPTSHYRTRLVFVRRDAVKKPLQQPYDGPYRVLRRSSKFYTLDLIGRTDTVSVDLLKPAHLDSPITNTLTPAPATTSSTVTPSPQPTPPPQAITQPLIRTTRSGRHVHWPKRLVDFVP